MAGGIEKNITLLANHLAAKGISVTLITFDLEGARAFYEITPKVAWHRIGRTKPHGPIGFKERLDLIKSLRHILIKLGDPVVICFHHGILFRFMAAAMHLGLPFVCSERNSLSLYQYIKRTRKWSLDFLLLALTDKITVQFPSYVKDYPFWLRGRIRVIPNPVASSNFCAKPQKPGGGGRFRLITVGRLCTQKNQLVLMEAFVYLSPFFPEWDLYILGDGPDEEKLRQFVEINALQDRIIFPGRVKDVDVWLAGAHLFCLPSQWEGFPNALAEAMACGLPGVGFASCAGVRDLVIDGKTGLLAADNELSMVLGKLMSSPELRKEMGDAARDYISQYRPESSFQKWDELLSEYNGLVR
jgi:glycosyltransferase involved in cell wall biosynthesis